MPHRTDHTLTMSGDKVLIQHVGYVDYAYTREELIFDMQYAVEPRKTILNRALKFLNQHKGNNGQEPARQPVY